MRIIQLAFMGLIALALVSSFRKAPRKAIGAIIGGVLGFFIPFLFALAYSAGAKDPTAGGAFSFFTLFTVPAGIAIGIAVGAATTRRKDASGKNKS